MRQFTAHPEHGIAWISGASSGIGRALALRLAAEGYKVAVTARDHAKLVELQAEASDLPGAIIVLDGDVTDPEDMEHVVASIEYQHGNLALAIFNAGIYVPVHGDRLQREDFERTIAVNLSGVVNCLVPAIRHMKARGQGQIAIVSSAAGYGGLPGGAAYGATKAALITMAESLKFDLDEMGIHVQLINPGVVDTAAAEREFLAAPPLMTAEEAADRIAAGLKSQSFEITFPTRANHLLKLLRFLPYGLYFRAIERFLRGSARPQANHGASPHPAE